MQALLHCLKFHFDCHAYQSSLCLFPAGKHDSIEADSIVKSARNADSTLSVGDSDSALSKSQAMGKAAIDAVADKADTLTDQKNAVADSLDHIKDNVVTAVKSDKITDPEQEFKQGELPPVVTFCRLLSDVHHHPMSLISIGITQHALLQ